MVGKLHSHQSRQPTSISRSIAEHVHTQARDSHICGAPHREPQKKGHLQKARGLRSHPHVQIRLQALEVVMKVCSESVYQIDRVLRVLGVSVPWEEH